MGKPMNEEVKTHIKKIANSLNTYVESKDFSHFLEIESYLQDFFDALEVKFWRYDGKDETLHILDDISTEPLALSNSLTKQAIDTKSSLIANHVTSNKYYDALIDNPSAYKIKALLVFPVIKNKKVLGVVRIWRGLKQRKNFVKKDEDYLALFMPLFIDIFESKSITKDDLLHILNEEKREEKLPKQKINPDTSSKKVENYLLELEKTKETLARVEQESSQKIKALEDALSDYEKKRTKKDKTLLNTQKTLDATLKKYEELEKSSVEIYQESQNYQHQIKDLTAHVSLLETENKTFQKELKKQASSTVSIKKLKLEKSLVSPKSAFNTEQNIEFLLQNVDKDFVDNEYAYMLFELMVYALSSKKGMGLIEEHIHKSKLVQQIMNKYYFKGDLQIHNEKFRIADMLEHIKGYEKRVFDNLVKLQVKIDNKVPVSLVFDAAKIQSIILHLLMDLHQFVDHHQPMQIDFMFKKKFLFVELGGTIHKRNSLFESMFKQNKLAGDEKDRIGLLLSKKLIESLKGSIEHHYEDDYYKFILTVPVQVIKM